jgi:hypothetical protein
MTTAQSAPTVRKSLRDLRKSDATLFCKNNGPTIIVANDRTVQFELQPFEIAIMPKECLAMSGIQKLWMRKEITISDDEGMEDEIILHLGGIVEMPAGPRPVAIMRDDGTWAEEVPTLTQHSGARDIVMGVNEKGEPVRPKCIIGGEAIFQTRQQLDAGEPPLCPIHAGEAFKVVSIQNQDGSWSHKLPIIER